MNRRKNAPAAAKAAGAFWLRQQESNLRWGSQSPLPYRLAMAHRAAKYSIFSAVPQEGHCIFAAFSPQHLERLRRFLSFFGLLDAVFMLSISCHVFYERQVLKDAIFKKCGLSEHKIHLARVKIVFFIIFIIFSAKSCIFCCGSGTLDVINID